MDEFDKFRELLEKTYQFPAVYPHKFIGMNSPEFVAAVQALEKAYPGLKVVSANLSATGKHLAMTYEFAADQTESIVCLLKSTHQLPDLLYVL